MKIVTRNWLEERCNHRIWFKFVMHAMFAARDVRNDVTTRMCNACSMHAIRKQAQQSQTNLH